MKVKFKGKEKTLKFTFNSFRYMEDFDISEMEEMENKPFKIIGITEKLAFGAFNHNPKKFVKREEVSEFLEKYAEENSIVEFMTELMEELDKSSFFKNLQMVDEKVEKKSKK